jgi:hypothetical protein
MGLLLDFELRLEPGMFGLCYGKKDVKNNGDNRVIPCRSIIVFLFFLLCVCPVFDRKISGVS